MANKHFFLAYPPSSPQTMDCLRAYDFISLGSHKLLQKLPGIFFVTALLLLASCTERVQTPTASASVADPSDSQPPAPAIVDSVPTSPAQMSFAQLTAALPLPDSYSDRIADHLLNARISAARSQLDPAIRSYALALLSSQAADDNPLTAQTLLELSRLLLEHSYYRAAADTYQRLATVLAQIPPADLPSPALRSLASSPGRVWASIARLHSKLDDTATAIATYDKARQLSPDDSGVQLFCVRGLAQISQFDHALAILNDLSKDDAVRTEVAESFLSIRDLQGHRDHAVNDLNQLQSQYPDDSRIAVVLASYYLDTDQLARAREILTARAQLDPRFTTIYQTLADLEIQEKQPAQAVQWLARMVHANNAAIVDARWRILRMLPDKDHAAKLLAQLETLDRLKRDYALSWAAGTVAESAGLTAQANTYYRTAIALRPRLGRLYLYLIRSYLRQGQPDAALAIIAAAQEAKFTPHSDFYRVEGLAHLLKDDIDAALVSLEAAVGADPDDSIAREILANTLLSVGRPDDAAAHLQLLINDKPDSQSLLRQLISAHLADGRPQRAVSAAGTFMAANRLSDQAVLDVAQAFAGAKMYTHAQQLLGDAPPAAAHVPRWQDLFLRSLVFTGQVSRARREFAPWLENSSSQDQRALLASRIVMAFTDAEKLDLALEIASDEFSSAPHNPLLREVLVYLLIERKDYHRAHEFIAAWLAENPDRPTRLLAVSLSLARRDFDQAQRDLDSLLSEDAEDIKALHLLASLYELTGKFELASQQYNHILTISPDDIWANNNQGFYLADTDTRLDDAEWMIRSALRSAGPDSAVVDSMGWVYYKRGRFGQALLYVSRALRLDDEHDAEGLDHLGDIYYRLNEPDQAVGAWQRALTAAKAADPRDRQRLKRLQKKLKLIESDQGPPVAFSVVDVQPESPPPIDD